MRLLTVIVGTIVTLLIAVYGFLPWLVGLILPTFVISLAGIEHLELEIGHPGFSEVVVQRATLHTRNQSLEIQDLRLSYTLDSLFARRADRATIATAVLTWTDSPGDQPNEPPARDPAPVGLSIADLFSLVPVDSVTVDALTIAAPSQDFLAGGQLELNHNRIDLTLKGQTPEIARDLQLNARLSADGQVQVAFRDPDAELPSALSIDAEVESDKLKIRADLQLAGYGFDLIQDLIGLEPLRGLTEGRLSATWTTTLPWPLDSQPDWRTLDGSGSFEFDGSFEEPDTRLNGIAGVLEVAQGQIDLELSGAVRMQMDAITLAANIVDGRFTFNNQTLSSERPGMALQITSPDVGVTYQPQTLEFELADTPILSSAGTLFLSASAVEVEGRVETHTRKMASNYVGDLSFDGNAKLDREVDESYPLLISSDHTIADQQLDASLLLSSGALQSVPLTVHHDLAMGTGSISIHHRQSVFSTLFTSTIPNWPPQLDLDSGAMTVDGQLDWDDSITGRVAVNVESVNASFDDFSAAGLTGNLKATLENASWTLQPSTLAIELIDIGVPVAELTTEISGNLKELRFRNLQAQALGGRLQTDGFDYDVENGAAELLLDLMDLELTEVLALEGEDITGTGRLRGKVPISVNQNIARIHGGWMSASDVGLIRLSPELAATITQPGLDIALKALENFSYERLETIIDYDEKGAMRLGIRLEGSNPDLEEGRSVHFNLNISENLPVLLESLRVQDSFVEQIEKKIQ